MTRETMNILLVGQTPPPVCGQTLVIESILNGDFRGMRIHHVRMGFSKHVGEMGAFRPGKLVELVRVISEIVVARFRHRADVLWYPPAGGNMVPMLRDLAILLSTRWLFKKTVFYFHAGGLSELYEKLPWLLRPLFRAAYFRPDVAMRVSELVHDDGAALGARKSLVVRNGIEDTWGPEILRVRAHRTGPPIILFVGLLSADKGVLTLLDAAARLARRGVAFHMHLMGRFESARFDDTVRDFVTRENLGEQIQFLGERTGEEKRRAFLDADILSHPSCFETFGLSIVEGMSAALPVVATRVGGIPSVMPEGCCGYLVPKGGAEALASRLQELIEDRELRIRMGAEGRRHYLDNFTLNHYHNRLRAALAATAGDSQMGRRRAPAGLAAVVLGHD